MKNIKTESHLIHNNIKIGSEQKHLFRKIFKKPLLEKGSSALIQEGFLALKTGLLYILPLGNHSQLVPFLNYIGKRLIFAGSKKGFTSQCKTKAVKAD